MPTALRTPFTEATIAGETDRPALGPWIMIGGMVPPVFVRCVPSHRNTRKEDIFPTFVKNISGSVRWNFPRLAAVAQEAVARAVQGAALFRDHRPTSSRSCPRSAER